MNVCVLPRFICWSSNSVCLYLKVGPLWGKSVLNEVIKVDTMIGLVTLPEEKERRALSISLSCEDRKRRQPYMQAKERTLTRNRIESSSTLILDSAASRLWEINVCHLSQPVYGILFWLPELTKIFTRNLIYGRQTQADDLIFYNLL